MWPPTAKDLSIEKCLKFVKVLVFNFVSIITGHVDIVEEWTQYADVDRGIQRKILSIAQDLVHVSTSGATATPNRVVHVCGTA